MPIGVLLDTGRPVRSLLLLERERARLADRLATLAAPVYLAPPEVIDAVAGAPPSTAARSRARTAGRCRRSRRCSRARAPSSSSRRPST